MPKSITAVTVEKAKKAEPGKRLEKFDTQAPGLCLRISDTGHKSFVWRGRIRGEAQPIRILIGDARITDIGDAREKARAYAKQAGNGEDPRSATRGEKEKLAIEAAAKFEIVVDRYVKEVAARMARPKAVEGEIRDYLIPPLEGRPIVKIKDEDIATIVAGIRDDGKHPTAGRILNHAKAIFKWASSIEQRKWTGLRINPLKDLTADTFKLALMARNRSLSDDETQIVWNAAGMTDDPWKGFVRMLLLSGLRKSEVSNATWREFNFNDKTWVIPPERMKGKPGKRRAHLVPLTPMMLEILEGIKASQPDDAKFVFSSTNGRQAITSFSLAKTKLDAKIAEIQAKQADGGKFEPIPPWTFHDTRRTVRTGLAKMEEVVPYTVAERVIAHAQSGIGAVYNTYDYAEAKRKALTLWNSRLKAIIAPSDPDNLLAFRKAAR